MDRQYEDRVAAAETWVNSLDPDTTPVENIEDLRAVAEAVDDVESAEQRVRDAVAAARRTGRSWARIALALGVTKQAAHERFNSTTDAEPVQAGRRTRATGRLPMAKDEAEADEGLFEHLELEFLEHGRRAVEFLHTAHGLLNMPPESLPRHAGLIGYCLREAMKAIPASQDVDGGERWRSRSREVVIAKQRYEMARDLAGEASQAPLDALLVKIDDMALTHEQDRIHQQRLLAVIVNRSGAVPLDSGTDPVRTYQNLLDRCDNAVHGELTFDEAQQLYDDCLAVLRQLFMPPEVRHRRLATLAARDIPSGDDVSAVLKLVIGPNHLQYFLSRIRAPRWLDLLEDSGVLHPPASQAPWPVFAAVEKLKEVDPTGVAAVLARMFDQWGAHTQRAWYIARAAVDLGSHGRGIVLRAVQRHPASYGLAFLAVETARRGDPTDEFVEQVADVVLNPILDTATHVGPRLLGPFVDGVTAENYARRIRLLCFKLQRVPADDHARAHLRADRGGSIGDPFEFYRDDRFTVLLQALAECLQRALSVRDAVGVLEALEALPDDLSSRIRAWVLGHATEVEPAMLIAEVARAIGSRLPTGDDLRLVDRIVAEVEPAQFVDEWRQALPTPPSVTELGTALAADEVPDAWRGAFEWSGLLPAEVTTEWATAVPLLSGRYGEPSRAWFEQPMMRVVDVGFGRSPLGDDEIRAMPVDEAARWIASWRPAPASWPRVGVGELASTLEKAVKAAPASWGSSPLKTVGLLRHPTYIERYLRGLAAAESFTGIPVDELLDAVAFIRTHPWDAVPLGGDSLASDADWRAVEQASVDLIKSLAASDLGFGDHHDEVWSILRSEVLSRGEQSGLGGGSLDPLEMAINRPCTRALEAVLVFMGHEFRIHQVIRAEALELLTSILELPDSDGAEHRAILAPRVGFLRHIASDWVEQHREQLFGDAAPTNLGQLTIDLALKWGQPNSWLLENYPHKVEDAVRRDVDNALEQYLVAMLRQTPGYGVSDAFNFHGSLNKLSEAAEALGRLLRPDNAPARAVTVAIEFWTLALENPRPESLAGFGWFAEISAVDEEIWEDLTLRTLTGNRGRIDWAHKVAERAAASPPNPHTLAILNELVRGRTDEWDRRRTAELAVQALAGADGLANTSEYQRLRITLLERGLTDSEGMRADG